MTAGLDRHRRLDYETHREFHPEPPRHTVEEIVAMAEAVDLRGRGGAAFPFARKFSAVVAAARRKNAEVVVVVNGTEGEPASTKDKMLLLRKPHLIIDGALIAADALNAVEVVIGVAEGHMAQNSIIAAVEERKLDGYVRVVGLPERFVTGEGGSVVNGIMGREAVPRGRGGRTSDSGVRSLPTLLSNAETYSQLAILSQYGPDGYAEAGAPDEPGTVLLTIGGSAMRPAVVETPTGVPLATVLDICGAVVGDGVLVGGYHGRWLTPVDAASVPVSRKSLADVGGVLGAGIIVPLGGETCPLGETVRVTSYLAAQSAGQCGPCRLGLPDVAYLLKDLSDGNGSIEAVRWAAVGTRGRGACSHPDGTSRFVLSALDTFKDDISQHLMNGTCGRPVYGLLPIPADDDSKLRLVVDWTRCQGHGLCAKLFPDRVNLDAHGYPVISDSPVSNSLLPQARKAIEMCPALALRIEEG
ncbi:NADH:ubiquinone oxidoreductase subunit F (NADH-binding)/ferredoxin [Thermocatellispora tengchongensis]|uniref:NADH:ubiquinone oxidoreductase subunit F (NADH-binding)/ferredoxin n=1 Tax=Thermocatellispora tengchongensis TaxID=1073253 RepID=A0A840PMC7_9ACTN|nr:NADH-ubiquinone oxidoreductase-F iron-sulfur binding region domain-containing protein [Thermocatellispora tengchongensis]MBB5140099.1 NADH:ubiquinone oxidoreductase subunit F (NADH-binding)/ferredoxin [Thermocatellispora tengchongensis]